MGNNGPDIGAPISEWLVMRRGFATVHKCEQYRDRAEGWFGIANLSERRIVPEDPRAFRNQWRCTPDDDPRLKSK
jgi:hypothetical protein